jgi:hypothetical protein
MQFIESVNVGFRLDWNGVLSVYEYVNIYIIAYTFQIFLD